MNVIHLLALYQYAQIKEAEKSKVDYSSKAKTGKSTNVRDFLAAKNTVHGATRVDRSI